ncbi:MAG: hypothetical protein KC475_09815 [Cyanobacteria bacterium HKST-UBA03]|nr:hypothetical protein [Cyanobacteria bacterium HKST-UBA03]
MVNSPPSFAEAFDALTVMNGPQPWALIPDADLRVWERFANARSKDWASTVRWNPQADLIGLLGEVVAQRYFGYSAEQAQKVYEAGLEGDDGYDLVV